MNGGEVRFDAVEKSFADTSVLVDTSLSVSSGQFAVIYGQPASGKSVLLRMLVGLETPDAGRVFIRGVDAATLRPGDRNIGYVPQSFALFPNKTVRQNIAYPLTIARTSAAKVIERVDRVAELLDIATLLDRKPDQLSGGQKQRVAIARGLVRETEIYVLDDPLVGLDFKLRERLVDDLRATRVALNATFLYATSDAGEGLALASHVAILSKGQIVEYDTPYSLYRRPMRRETMTGLCFPEANVITGQLAGDPSATRFVCEFGRIDVVLDRSPETGSDVVAIVRAEHVQLGSVPSSVGLGGRAEVAMREDLGAEEIVYLDAKGQQLTALVRADAIDASSIELGEQLDFRIEPEHVVLFDGNHRIGQGTTRANGNGPFR